MQDLARKASSGSGRNAENEYGDIVGASAIERHVHQRLASLRRRVGACDAGQVRIPDHSPESVSAKKKDVALF